MHSIFKTNRLSVLLLFANACFTNVGRLFGILLEMQIIYQSHTKVSGLMELAKSGGTRWCGHVHLAQPCSMQEPSARGSGAPLLVCVPLVALVTRLKRRGEIKKIK